MPYLSHPIDLKVSVTESLVEKPKGEAAIYTGSQDVRVHVRPKNGRGRFILCVSNFQHSWVGLLVGLQIS
jgi:hypothetical protein